MILTPVCENTDATYSIVGNSNLKNGSKVIVKVSDKEGSIREYTINVKKSFLLDLSFLSKLEFKWIVLILEFIIIFILILVILFRRGNKPRKPKKVKMKKEKNNVTRVTANVCKACGTVNDIKSKTCYICGNLLK